MHDMYDSPFELITSGIAMKVAKELDDACVTAIQSIGVNVDKDKLIRILSADSERYRDAYKKGYETGYKTREDELIRCKDCKECYFAYNRIQSEQTFACGKHGIDVTQDWFCADGERRTDDA